MSLYFYEPNYNWDRLFDDPSFPRTSDNNQRRLESSGGSDIHRQLRPSMDLHEDAVKNAVTATFELPGIRKEDVQIDVHNGRLIVSADSKMSEEHTREGYAVRERRFGRFSRTLQLPQGVQYEDVQASMVNGVLTVTFPKASKDTASKRITIN